METIIPGNDDMKTPIILTGQDASILALFARTDVQFQQQDWAVSPIQELMDELSNDEVREIAKAILAQDKSHDTARYFLEWVDSLDK